MTSTSTVFEPTLRESEPEAAPELTGEYVPLLTRAWIVAPAVLAVGVTVTELVALVTEAE